ncbi:DUF2288 domain-containing protein [Thiothrix nivea]|uniref:DUF2288 domain-containing protein n=1 Tax=Thiothrix nivea (strain ATCC 35100 / DSM 5205 / JP2) TaxID=870187 RepID=A0A656HJX4_THINJ|nr:DUF2288 domain-containing protein [Thiothrix nivea]EIJ35620.1 Protein of unknown function DUF2288 [Thiothrix nivea DSM 5205]
MEEFLPLRDRLNLETARISWAELERFFAAGKVIQVAAELDLVAVATHFAEDNSTPIKGWLQTGQLHMLTDATAKHWVQTNPQNLWAVVAAPWVLVQERPAP